MIPVMRKETYKNVILILLIVSSVVLTFNIWFVKELWSVDYSSFLYSFQNIFTSKDAGDKTTDELILRSKNSPAYIALTLNSKKIISYLGSDTFLKLEEIFSEITGVIVKDGSLFEITHEDFLAAHRTNSMLIRFMAPVSLTDYIKKDGDFFDGLRNPHVGSFIINVSDTKQLYFKDEATDKSYRLPIVYDDRKYRPELGKLLEAEELTDSFAFELNMDKKKPEDDRILFDSYAAMDISGSSISKLEVTPVVYNSHKSYDPIFKAFNIARNSARPYRDKDNVINFIENHSTFKISNNGSFVYEASKQSQGIPLNGDDELDRVVRFVNLLYDSSLPDSDGFLRVSDIKRENEENIYNFDYMTENGRVYFSDRNAVTLTVRDGNITMYRQFLCSIRQTGAYLPVANFMKAYDSVYKIDLTGIEKDFTIKNIYPANIYPDKIGWVAEFSTGDRVVLE